MKVETLQQLLETLSNAEEISVELYVKNMPKLIWYVKNHQFKASSTFLEHCIINNFLDLLKIYKDSLGSDKQWCNLAAEAGHLDVLKWLYTIGCPLSSSICALAAECAYLDILKWLRIAVNCLWDVWAAKWAARNNDLEMIKWLHDMRAPFDSTVAAEAAMYGHLNILSFLHLKSRIDKSSTNVCTFAAAGGQLKTLKWLQSINCSWDASTMNSALANGHKEVYEYLRGS